MRLCTSKYFLDYKYKAEEYLNRKRSVKPVNYSIVNHKTFRDKEIETKFEFINRMQATITNFNKELEQHVIDLTEDEIMENVEILLEASGNRLDLDERTSRDRLRNSNDVSLLIKTCAGL